MLRCLVLYGLRWCSPVSGAVSGAVCRSILNLRFRDFTWELNIDVLDIQVLEQFKEVIGVVEVVVNYGYGQYGILRLHSDNLPMLTRYHESITLWSNFRLELALS